MQIANRECKLLSSHRTICLPVQKLYIGFSYENRIWLPIEAQNSLSSFEIQLPIKPFVSQVLESNPFPFDIHNLFDLLNWNPSQPKIEFQLRNNHINQTSNETQNEYQPYQFVITTLNYKPPIKKYHQSTISPSILFSFAIKLSLSAFKVQFGPSIVNSWPLAKLHPTIVFHNWIHSSSKEHNRTNIGKLSSLNHTWKQIMTFQIFLWLFQIYIWKSNPITVEAPSSLHFPSNPFNIDCYFLLHCFTPKKIDLWLERYRLTNEVQTSQSKSITHFNFQYTSSSILTFWFDFSIHKSFQ